ncbi:MAG TPA: alpha/beta hydrolase [Polyangiaceae bacterium]
MVNRRRLSFIAWGASIVAIAIGAALGCSRKVEQKSGGPSAPEITGSAGRLHVDDGGKNGLPLLFVHSYAGSSANWSAQLAYFRPTRRAVAFDLRGHGKSQAPASGDYAVKSLAGDIASVADGLHLDRFVLIGHSMGGSAAIAYAGAHADRVAGLVLVGTPGQSAPDQANQVMDAMRADYDNVSEGYWKKLLGDAQPNVESQIRSDMKRIPRDASLAIFGALFAYDPLPALRAYPGAKLLVDTPHGEGPSSLHTQAPEIPRRLITQTSHWPHMDKPEEFNAILTEFLANAS